MDRNYWNTWSRLFGLSGQTLLECVVNFVGIGSIQHECRTIADSQQLGVARGNCEPVGYTAFQFLAK